MTRALLPLVALLFSGCGGSPVVTRIVGGETLPGRFIDPEAYAAFFRGAAAEEQGQWDVALKAYEEARDLDDDDAEIWTRIGVVRCRAKPGDGVGREALARALAVDPEYGPAHEGLAMCGESQAASLAAQAEPRAIAPQLWLAKLEKGQERLVGLALDRSSAVAWDALAVYAVAKGNPWLAVSASAAAAARDDSRATAAAERSAELAGDGELGAARALAGILLDARARRAVTVPPLVARLGVDEALERADEARAMARASSAHMGLDEVAARAILLGQPQIGWNIATLVADADPASAGAQVARVAAEEALGKKPHAIQLARPSAVPASVALAYGRALARTTTREAAADALRALRREPLRAGDALETSVSVDLAARAVLEDGALPPDAQLELAVRRRAPFPAAAAEAAKGGKVDARHRFLYFAWTEPAGQDAARLAERLTRSGSRDPLVGAAVVHIASATGKSVDAASRDRLAQTAPADPIVWATLVDAQSSDSSRRRLATVAVTKAEHDLSRF